MNANQHQFLQKKTKRTKGTSLTTNEHRWTQISAWTLASGTTNWSAPNLTLLSGTNIIRAYAQDTSGNNSRTNSISFRH
jgi:hypothetical protein